MNLTDWQYKLNDLFPHAVNFQLVQSGATSATSRLYVVNLVGTEPVLWWGDAYIDKTFLITVAKFQHPQSTPFNRIELTDTQGLRYSFWDRPYAQYGAEWVALRAKQQESADEIKARFEPDAA